MERHTKASLGGVAVLALVGAIVIGGQSDQQLIREDYSYAQIGAMPPMYFRTATSST